MTKTLYIMLLMLGTFLSGHAAPVRHAFLTAAGSEHTAAVHRQQKVKSEGEPGIQICCSVRAGTSFRPVPTSLKAEFLVLPAPGSCLGAPVARLGIPAAKHYLDQIYPSHHFW